MLFTLVLLSVLLTAVDAKSLRHRRHVPEDPLISMFRQQEQAMQQLSNLVANVSHMMGEKMERIEKAQQRLEMRLYSHCPTLYTIIGQSCYKLYTDKTDWFEARKKCQADGAQLVAIETAAEQGVVVQLISGYPRESVWIGGNDHDTEGHFVWDATGSDLYYTNWEDGQPNNLNGSQNCVEIAPTTNTRKWNDELCSYKQLTLCEAYRPDESRG